MEEKLNWVKRIGNFVSNLLLGETKELIVRTDERVRNMTTTIDQELKPDVKDIRERFGAIAVQVNTMWADRLAPNHSPRQLNEKGIEILTSTGIKEIVDRKKDQLLALVKARAPQNPYDAEQVITEVMAKLHEHCPDVVDSLKEGAFKEGVDLGAVLFVGSIYLRNLIFPELGFTLEDLDRPQVGE